MMKRSKAKIFRFDAKTKAQLEALAQNWGCTTSEAVRRSIEIYANCPPAERERLLAKDRER